MNRALEFLNEAYSQAWYFPNSNKVRLLISLTVAEVQELLDRVALLEQQSPQQIPAILVESHRRQTPQLPDSAYKQHKSC